MGCWNSFIDLLADLLVHAKVWNATTTILAGGLLIAGTTTMVQTCTVTDSDTPSYECVGQTSELISNELIFALLISMGAFIFIFLYEILVAAGMTCDLCCKNERHTITVALAAAISATVYVDYAVKEMDIVPTTAVSNPEACFVCPDAKSDTGKGLLYSAVTCTWVGFAACCYIVCCMYNSNDNNDNLGVQLTNMKDDEVV